MSLIFTDSSNSEVGEQLRGYLAKLEWCVEPWPEVSKLWKDTSEYRVKQLRSEATDDPISKQGSRLDTSGKAVVNYFKKYRAVNQPLGYSLVRIMSCASCVLLFVFTICSRPCLIF